MDSTSTVPPRVATEAELATVAAALAGRVIRDGGGRQVQRLLKQAKQAIGTGADPLGDEFCRLRSAERRRGDGAVYTPRRIVDAMVSWAARVGTPPARIVDPGAGSGRFLLAAGRAFRDATLVAVEVDPLARLLLEANAKALGMDQRLTVLSDDYRSIRLSRLAGPTLFVGNPPYIRHHGIPRAWKEWFAGAAAELGLGASKLAGMHVHFLLKTCQLAGPGDYGAFVTAAEWLDVNYGDLVRKMLTKHLGGISVHVIRAGAMPFPGTATTAAVTCFRVGETGGIRFRRVAALEELDGLRGGTPVSRTTLAGTPRWSTFLRPAAPRPRGHFELGELCSVHRGQVTGCNRVWIAGTYPGELPAAFLEPVVSRARELFEAGPSLGDASLLHRLVSLPEDLDELDEEARPGVERFLAWARKSGAHRSYVATHRRKWWSVPLGSSGPDSVYLHGASPTRIRAQSVRCPTPEHRPRNLPARPGRRVVARRPVGVAPGQRTHVRRQNLRGRIDQIRTPGGRTNPHPPLEELRDRTETLDARRTDTRCHQRPRVVSPMAAD